MATGPRIVNLGSRPPAPGHRITNNGHQGAGTWERPPGHRPGTRDQVTATRDHGHQVTATGPRLTANACTNLGAINCAPGTTATGPAGAAQVTRSTGHQARPVQRGPRKPAPGLGFLRAPAGARSSKTTLRVFNTTGQFRRGTGRGPRARFTARDGAKKRPRGVDKRPGQAGPGRARFRYAGGFAIRAKRNAGK